MEVDLGPDTLLWRHLDDRRYIFVLPRAVCLQLLHPTIATGISEHALMRERIWLHKKRTVNQAIRIAYTDTDMRPHIRFAHEHVKGHDPAGNKYHALNPDVFHFQHATYVESLVMMVNTFIRKLDDDEHEQLYQECCSWYRRYGISTRPMPASWPEFCEYFEDECHTQLSAGEHFEPFRRQMFAPTDWWVRAVPAPVIRAMQHPRAVELTGISVSAGDRRSLRRFTMISRLLS
ncbi:oxygenase MpaB family protein [Mycobacterium sp. GA-1841]|uniref:oxygenase MpaB family protein n=1 Tax=Mycobacterium sp. GA-1841 TaxID=1834154 RepID=UPI0011156B0B|nr:oxygenase MpaB family protein [Mycobacterium sp. GA-1841]